MQWQLRPGVTKSRMFGPFKNYNSLTCMIMSLQCSYVATLGCGEQAVCTSYLHVVYYIAVYVLHYIPWWLVVSNRIVDLQLYSMATMWCKFVGE